MATTTASRHAGQAGHRSWRLSPYRQLPMFVVLEILIFFLVPDLNVGIGILVHALWAASLALLVGYGGLISFGHALPFGYGGYTAGLLLRQATSDMWLVLIGAMLAMGVLSLVVGAVCLRRTEVYFSMLTLAFAQLGFFVALQARGVTGGDDGLGAIPSAVLHLPGSSLELNAIRNPEGFFLFTAAIVLFAFAFLVLYTDSPAGRVLEAIRESEERARGCGYQTRRVQLLAFLIAGMSAGLAGGLFAAYNNFVGLQPYWLWSGVVLIMVVVGGRRSLFGAAIGATVFLLLEHYLSNVLDRWQLVVGVVFVTSVLLFPQGLWGLVDRSLELRPGQRRSPAGSDVAEDQP